MNLKYKSMCLLILVSNKNPHDGVWFIGQCLIQGSLIINEN